MFDTVEFDDDVQNDLRVSESGGCDDEVNLLSGILHCSTTIENSYNCDDEVNLSSGILNYSVSNENSCSRDVRVNLSTGIHHCSVYKAKVPLSQLIKLVDDNDIDNLVNYRCPHCSKCMTCLESNRTKTMSLQESMEQDLISQSVTLDLESGKVLVDLPFIKEPVEALLAFHKGRFNNRYQAEMAFKSQCRKPAGVKSGIRKAG